MTQRIAQLIGYTTGCTVQIDWNGATVFSGHIEPAGDNENPTVLAQWNTDTTVTGAVPLSIQCSSGGIFFVNVFVNMYAPKNEFTISDQAQWIDYTPASSAELLGDMQELSDSGLQQKYGLTRATLRQWLLSVETVGIEDNFEQPFKRDWQGLDDGKNNVAINGEAQTRHDIEIWPGPWHWFIANGDVLTCDFTVSPPPG